MGFSRQEHWSGLTFPSPGDLPDPGIEPGSPTLEADALTSATREACCCCCVASVMSDSVRPHRWHTTRLHHPWDSPGKNTGVGCHFLFQCMKMKSESEVAQSCPTLNHPVDCSPPSSSIHGIFQARVLEWGAIAFSRVGWGDHFIPRQYIKRSSACGTIPTEQLLKAGRGTQMSRKVNQTPWNKVGQKI